MSPGRAADDETLIASEPYPRIYKKNGGLVTI